MGKKKIAKPSTEAALKEGVATEAAAEKAQAAVGLSRQVKQGKVYINASYNNTSITVTDTGGNVLAWATAGSLGFNGPKKATPFAASKVVAALAERLRKSGPIAVEVIVKGAGSGRDSAIRSIANQGFTVLSIKDVTPIPHNGPRPPKVRRV